MRFKDYPLYACKLDNEVESEDDPMPVSESENIPRLALGPNRSLWRLWLTRVVIFSVVFVLLVSVLSLASGIVERFFILLYTE